MRLWGNLKPCWAACMSVMIATSTMAGSSSNTAFSYQGQLKRDGVPVTDTCDFVFQLFDAADGGTQQGAFVEANGVDVVNGLLTVQLDFGSGDFTGEPRWLSIGVACPTGEFPFDLLRPRVRINATPYAIQTRGIFVDDVGRVGLGTSVPESDLHLASDASIQIKLEADTDNNSGGESDQPSILFSQDGGIISGSVGFFDQQNSMALRTLDTGSGVAHLLLLPEGNVGVGTANQLSTGKLVIGQADDTPNHGLSIFDSTAGQSLRLWVDPNDVRRIDGGASGQATVAINGSGVGRVGIGTTNPTSPLHLARVGNWSPAVGDGWGDFSLNNGTVGLSFGVATGGGGTGDVRIWTTGGTERLFLGSATGGNALAVGGNGNVGIGTGSPAERLHVNGNLRVDGDVILPPRIETFSVSPFAFTNIENTRVEYFDGIWPAVVNDVFGSRFQAVASVQLPHGQSLVAIRASIDDQSAAGDLAVAICRSKITAGNLAWNCSAGALSENTGRAIISTTFESGQYVIDNVDYSYYLRFDSKFPAPDARVVLYGITLDVEVKDTMP